MSNAPGHPADNLWGKKRDIVTSIQRSESALPSVGRADPAASVRDSVSLRSTTAQLPPVDHFLQQQAAGERVLFSDLVLREVKALGEKRDEFQRRPRVDGVRFSVDDKEVKDLDQGFSFRREADGSVVIGLSVTDVSAWIRPGSALDFAARLRVQSAYGGDIALPMLPVPLSDDRLSLHQGQERLAKTLEMRFALDGKLLGHRMLRTVFVNDHRLDSAAAEASRAAGKDALGEALDGVAAVASKLDPTKTPPDQLASKLSVEKALRRLTELANLLVAQALVEAHVETSFRNQLEPNKPASYDARPLGHFSVGGRPYVRWTAPLRRYADLDVHRALDRQLDRRQPTGEHASREAELRRIQHLRSNGSPSRQSSPAIASRERQPPYRASRARPDSPVVSVSADRRTAGYPSTSGRPG